MFELDGSQYEKGKFELRLRKKLSGPLNAFLSLGPIRGRFVVLAILLIAAFATIQRQPGNLFITNGWVASPEGAAQVQSVFSWGMCILAVLIWLIFLIFREETLTLVWDKTKSEFRTHHVPKFRQRIEQQGLYPFKDILETRVFSKEHDPAAKHGFMRIRVKDSDGLEKSFDFKFLSDEQFKFFPLNIYRITQASPVGDWKDPDSEIV